MELTEQEKEIIAWFLALKWQEFSEEAAESIGISALHRLAEKLGLSTE